MCSLACMLICLSAHKLICLRTCHVRVLTCLVCLHAYLLPCLTCTRAYVLNVLLCLCAGLFSVFACPKFLGAYIASAKFHAWLACILDVSGT